MNNQLSVLQTYRMKVHFFDMIFFSTYDDDLAGCCGGSFIYSANEGECPETMDPAYWEDWMDAVKVVMQDNSITYDSVTLTVEQSYAVMHQYLVRYCEVGSGQSMRTLRDLTNQNVQQSQIMQRLLGLWNKSLQIVLQEDPHKKDGLGFGENTSLDRRESFVIMRVFLDILCQYNQNQDLIKIVQDAQLQDHSDYWAAILNIKNPRLWIVWQQAIDSVMLHEQNNNLNLLVAYKAMPIFLINYFDKKKSALIDAIILNFKTENYAKPRDLFYWWAWIDAVIEVNAEQVVIGNNLVSIKTGISQNVALKIIKIWFENYKDRLGVNFIDNLILDTSTLTWEQLVDSIKESKRSYSLQRDEITILEAYYLMLKLLELHGKILPEFEIDKTEISIDLYLMLQWIQICEQIIHEKIN